MTLDEIMLKISQNKRYSALGFDEWQLSYGDFGSRASEYIDKNRSLYVSDEIKDELKAFFGTLGTSDIDSQISICKTYFEKFSGYEHDLRESAKSNRKLYTTLGILGAVFTAVVLI